MNIFSLADRWLKTLEQNVDKNRYLRGRDYFLQHRVKKAQITPGQFLAEVVGSENYFVAIEFELFSNEEKEKIYSLLQQNPYVVAASSFIFDQIISQMDIDLLKRKIQTVCNCPDDETICKHTIAASFALSSTLQLNPYKILLLRGIKEKNIITALESVKLSKTITLNSFSYKQLVTAKPFDEPYVCLLKNWENIKNTLDLTLIGQKYKNIAWSILRNHEKIIIEIEYINNNFNIQVKIIDHYLDDYEYFIFEVLKKYPVFIIPLQNTLQKIISILPEMYDHLYFGNIIELTPQEYIKIHNKFFIDNSFNIRIIGENIQISQEFKFILDLSTNKTALKNLNSILNFKQITKSEWFWKHDNDLIPLVKIQNFLEIGKKYPEQKYLFEHKPESWIFFDSNTLYILEEKIKKLSSELSHLEIMYAMHVQRLHGYKVKVSTVLKKIFESTKKYSLLDIPKNLNAELRPYQQRGFSWLIQNIQTGFGSILADDMGLGKTIQTIAVILHYKNQGLLKDKKALIIMPTGLMSNWSHEISRFAPDLKAEIYHGPGRQLPKSKYDVLLTSYGVIRSDIEKLFDKSWFLCIIDEAQNIKNDKTDQTKAIKRIIADHKIALSGTPVENKLIEYWSIFDFINCGYLGNNSEFKKRFVDEIEKERSKHTLEAFKKITAPFILRRLKNDRTIIPDLPDKMETNQYCALTKEQIKLYENISDVSFEEIEKSEGIQRKGFILSLITKLKQLCNHPLLVDDTQKNHIDASGKMRLLIDLLQAIKSLDEKTLIFTQYVKTGDLLVNLLEKELKIKIPFLHGRLTTKERDKIVKDFQTNAEVKILVVSLKAGGTGLNLTAANHVIHYDLWWNPAVENQATDRTYRIGQTKNVLVHRLLTQGTLEQQIDEIIQSKKELAELTVVTGEHWITEMSNKELKQLIKLRKL